ncbi:DUF4368 domain-containing protein [Mediterraneibacter glycyrrhizinilyticus]|nr:DUF4368 domain-containing protein [Mediterraneibacter glycyrrhizinilyticus]MDN0060684.1 DUF4368 domain-containing protein [Mediterraneibacter glycyrrhizinilyticus]
MHGLRGLHAVYAGLPEENQRQGAGVQGVCLQPVRFGRQRRLFFPLHQPESIEKIVVHEAVKGEDGSREQEVEIFYRFIGKID